ncbi:hypothetical protein K1T71_003264 [Dendrolimus kikuchii]|uniref:Uncharacterized protein n=1 Tax=Dendrolimus kikuchii TaxID=765133 RepID=A0ACC1DBQ5_9NEOP|nr:hypothetical protein K1T71_003264 [Dendrolimus kikuchii]
MESNGKTFQNSEEKANTKKRSNPNVFSRLFLWWVCPVLIKGNQRDVEEKDLIIPNKSYDSEKLGAYLERYWFEECERSVRKNRKPSLWTALRKAFWVSYIPSAFYIVTISALRVVQPMLFGQLLSYWSVEENMDRFDAGMYALAMLGLNFTVVMCQHHNNMFVARFGMKIKVACSSLLYRKVLRINQVSAGDIAGGKLVNLLSNDMARFDYSFAFMHYLWVVPIQAAVVLYFLFQAAGYAPFVGLFGIIILILPIQAFLTKMTAIVRRAAAQRTDKRIKLMSEIVNGIQVIKMYAWEKPFEAVVKAARAYEMKVLTKAIFIRSVFLGFMLFTERSILFVTTLTLALTGNLVTAALIYPIQQYFSIIQVNLTLIVPLAISSLSEMMVTLERIQNFLAMEEREDLMSAPKGFANANRALFTNNREILDDSADIMPKKYSSKIDVIRPISGDVTITQTPAGDHPIELAKVSATWSDTKNPTEEMTLKNLSLRIRKGKLCAIIGPVGSGKSSILQLILKELSAAEGSVNVKGKVSYASQEPWLFPETVRGNILFGVPYDPVKYKEVCRVCSLLPDFKQFPYGDLSLVGDRGVSLSGGQRARINLARSIYREADIYLLDDPLSAVDANVGRQLFDGCIRGYLRGRTCVLVTHQIHYLKAADIIVVLNEGAIENMGTYDDLIKSGKEFSKLLSNQENNDDNEDGDGIKKRPSFNRNVSKISTVSGGNQKDEHAQELKAEERQKGNLKWEVVFKYIASAQSWCLVGTALFVLLVTQAVATTADYWLSFWTNAVDEYAQSLPEGQEPDTSMDAQIGILTTAEYLYVYGGVIIALIILVHARIVGFVMMTMRASQNLYDTVYKKLIVAVMRFFDTNPSGRILNRISKDIGAVDEFLPRSTLETLQMYLSMASILLLNAIALPWTLIPSFVLLVVFIFLLKWYLNAAQAVKRLEGTTKSPVFGMINSTLSGLSTIRSSNSQHRLLNAFDNAQDLHSSAFYTFIGGSNAFGMYLDVLCLVYLGVIFTLFLMVDFGSIIPVGSIGLAVSQSMMLTMLLQMAARFTADFLGQMTAVERVLEYTRLPTEENMEHGPTKPPNEWPIAGHIQFEDLSLRYDPEEAPVLKNLNFEIKSGWKVGIVGRTGAGKSSLISALFRLYNLDGKIKIDGIETNGVAKKDLRSKISIIPQEPVLFSATLRYNLDPFNTYSDDEIWKALEQVELKEAIPALDFKVSEGGSNFSIGQRQLICLARAVLRSNKVLVMDEATANVDPQTDALIQKTIRREFANCTVLTIAHRLNTIMDSDRVLVMDKGTAAEFDTPYTLLSNPNSIFSFMVRETGESMRATLFEVAKTKYFSDNPN